MSAPLRIRSYFYPSDTFVRFCSVVGTSICGPAASSVHRFTVSSFSLFVWLVLLLYIISAPP